jgi:CHAT domain-containing protein/tetratricopeptide (TPR) repeat protein
MIEYWFAVIRKMTRFALVGYGSIFAMLLAVASGPMANRAVAQAPVPTPPTAPAVVADSPATMEQAKAAALAHMKAGRFADAVPHAEQALRLSETLHGQDAVESGIAAHNLGFLLRRANRVPEAQAHLERALAVYERLSPAIHEDTRNVAGELGQIYQSTGRGADAAGIYQRLIARADQEGDAAHIGVAHMRNNLAHLLRTLGHGDESMAQWEQALTIYSAQSSPEEEAYRLALEAVLDGYRQAGKPDLARALIGQTLQALQAKQQDKGAAVARLHTRLSVIEHDAGRYAEARQSGLAALERFDHGATASAPEIVEPLNNLARAERALANYAAAETYYKRAIAILNAHGRTANAGILSDNLAVLYGQMGRLDEAETLHKRALQLLESALGRDHRSVGQAAANFGAHLQERERHDEAEPLLRRGLAIAEAQAPQDPVLIATIVDNLAGLLRRTSRGREARESLSRALSLFERALPANHPALATARNNLGRLLLDLGEHAEAEVQLRRALEIGEGLYGAEHVNNAVYVTNLGELYAAMGQRAEARVLLHRALGMLERHHGGQHANLLVALAGLGHLELADGRPADALPLFERAVTIELASRDRAGGATGERHDRPGAERRTLHGLLEALWQAGETTSGRDAVRALDAGQWDTMTPAAVALSALGARAGAKEPALAALVRERQDLAAEWRVRDKRLTELLAQSGVRNVVVEAALRDRLTAIDARLANLIADVQARFPRYGDLARPAPLPIAELHDLLNDHEAALQYVVTRDATFVWVVTKTQTKWMKLPIGERDLASLVRALRCGLDRSEWDGPGRDRCLRLLDLPAQLAPGPHDPLPFQLARAHALFQILLAPLAPEIAGKDLSIVASGPLASLPFHVLVSETPDTAHVATGTTFAKTAWLGRRHAMTVLPSLGSLKALRTLAKASAASAPYLGFGNPLLTGADGQDRRAWSRQACPAPSMPHATSPMPVLAAVGGPAKPSKMPRASDGSTESLRRQSPLPETVDELCDVAQSLGAAPGTVLLGENATEYGIKTLSEVGALEGVRVLHFATHGLLAGEAAAFLQARGEPALMLTPPDTATELDDGLLTASEVAMLKLDADWVVLSACNTAGGGENGAEALSGLARAFFYAGARALLVSHWAVDSQATVKLVTAAFQAMARDPRMTQARALQQAMLTLVVSDGIESHPAYWAPFVTVGGSAIPAPDSDREIMSTAVMQPSAAPEAAGPSDAIRGDAIPGNAFVAPMAKGPVKSQPARKSPSNDTARVPRPSAVGGARPATKKTAPANPIPAKEDWTRDVFRQ